MTFTRRSFSKKVLSHFPVAVGALSLKPSLLTAVAQVNGPVPLLGLNTWSLRSLKHNQAIPAILMVMKESGLRNCQLLFSHAEPEEFDPDFAAMMSGAGTTPTQQERDEQKRKTAARTVWRQSVPMSYFAALRLRFLEQGLAIRSYAAPFGSSAEEIDRVFLMAKALGAIEVNGRLPEAQTDLVAAAAERHGLFAAIQVSNPQLLIKQLRTSPHLKANPDLGDLTKAGISALDFVKEHLGSISSIDLKDAVTGGGSVPFGTGQAHIREVVEFLAQTGSRIQQYIDCDYPGTGGSTDEVNRCVRFVREAIKS